MDATSEIVKRDRVTVDQSISDMALMRMKDVVIISEGNKPNIGFPRSGSSNAIRFLVSRLYTDAVFNGDIRAIQLIINRIDGGLPKDIEIDDYQTLFGDCLNMVMSLDDGSQLKVMPDDTVMMAMCKSLYDIATRDIYWDGDKMRSRRPTDAEKRDRDTAMRIVLERSGGRKTLRSTYDENVKKVEVAPWVAELSSGDVV